MFRTLSAFLVLAGLLGCAPTQLIGLHVGPEPLVVFVDGEAMDEVPVSIELTANRDHTLFFQRDGYRSQLVVVRTAEREGEDRLAPERVELELKRIVETVPSVSVELEEPLEP